ncbi:MAG TPA: hypothetical protein VNQ81_06955 [Povalibacter sp.]|nr:hypothetical protein [Povalibacter sp.]
MSGFSADWLALREPYDSSARDESLVMQLRQRLTVRPLQAIDLGTGTAANIRHLAPRLGGEQHWLTVDDDPELIALQPRELTGPEHHCRLQPLRLNLATELHRLQFDRCQLVTGSALLDLVSASWVDALASACAKARTSVLFALSYDGRIEWSPQLPDDDWLRDLLNRHQLGDKGFGPALGPEATEHTRRAFSAAGFKVQTASSDWCITPTETAMQHALMEGWSTAAAEIAPLEHARIAAWSAARRRLIQAGSSTLRVGHQDLLATAQ